MSFINPEQMALKDSANLDAFGRLRTAVGAQIFGTSQEYSPHPLVWDAYTVSGGTATHSTTTNSSVLSTNGTTSGARALRQTKTYQRYTPGKSQLIKQTGVLRSGGVPSGAAFAGIGYYDDSNGLFFRDGAAGASVAERSSVSGSIVETLTYQSSWNLDRFDGTGPSGKVVDWTKTQIFVIDLQWLGAGRVRFGLNIDGQLWYCHQSVHANLFPSVYMATANLPIRYEAFNSGGAGSNISLTAICSSLESEGGDDVSSIYPFAYSAYIGSPLAIDTTLRPVVARRLKTNFNGKTARGLSHLVEFDIRALTNDVYWEIRYNPTVTIGGGGSTITTDVDSTYSMSEYDTYTGALNTISGGVVMFNGFAETGQGNRGGVSSGSNANSLLDLGRTYAGVRDSFVLCARSMTGSASVSVAVRIEEHQ